VVGGAALVGSQPALAQADNYPSKPVKIVMPFPPGGMGDTLARILAEQLSKEWGQTVIVDNKPGASGMIGNEFVARAAPDGYTLLVAISQLVQAPALYPKLNYDVQKDFTPLHRLAGALSIFATTDPEIKSLKDYAAAAAKAPGTYSYGSYGAGTSSHIYSEIFNQQNKIKTVHVPYKGAAPMLNDMLAGHIKASFTDLSTTLPYLQSGKIRAYAVTGRKRSAQLPDVPTFAEQGISGMDSIGWYGFFGPAKLPQAVTDKIRNTTEKVLRSPEMQAKLASLGLEPIPATGPREDFAQRIQTDLVFWKNAIESSNIKIDLN
jgi:tripartite-type tricarboxylate transporter receptor subunit TctC